jgi:hypothetical protein
MHVTRKEEIGLLEFSKILTTVKLNNNVPKKYSSQQQQKEIYAEDHFNILTCLTSQFLDLVKGAWKQ